MANGETNEADSTASLAQDFWQLIRPPKYKRNTPPVRNANDIRAENLSVMDKIAVVITDKVGSFGFFLIIFIWTVVWTGYNILASEIPALHWKAFDPFPAFVAYLLISNVIQILLMPLIMVGQNLQARHSEIRAELDFETNIKAEKEVEVLLRHIEHNSELLVHLMRHLNCKLTQDEQTELKQHRQAIVNIIEEKAVPAESPAKEA